jgi:hypothetical protein
LSISALSHNEWNQQYGTIGSFTIPANKKINMIGQPYYEEERTYNGIVYGGDVVVSWWFKQLENI